MVLWTGCKTLKHWLLMTKVVTQLIWTLLRFEVAVEELVSSAPAEPVKDASVPPAVAVAVAVAGG